MALRLDEAMRNVADRKLKQDLGRMKQELTAGKYDGIRNDFFMELDDLLGAQISSEDEELEDKAPCSPIPAETITLEEDEEPLINRKAASQGIGQKCLLTTYVGRR